MSDKLKRTLEEIEIPQELNERSKLGIHQAKAEMPKKKWKRTLAVAAILFGFSTVTAGFAFPTVASNIPIIGDIFTYLGKETGLYVDYKNYSTELNMMEENNGIKITLNDAIYDGETVSLTYSVETEHDLGENPIIFDHLDIKGASGMSGSSRLEKVDDNKYVGMISASDVDRSTAKSVKVRWDIEGFTKLDRTKESEIKGDWNFAFQLDAIETEKKSIGKRVKERGVEVTVEKMTTSPVSVVLYYQQEVSEDLQDRWHDVYVDLEVKDDLGNVYSGQSNGGSGRDRYSVNWSKTFEKIHPDATKLIVTPHVSLRNSENFTEVEQQPDGTIKESRLPSNYQIGNEAFRLDEIVIEMK